MSKRRRMAEAAGEGLTGVILAGGQNRRMGGMMKALLSLEGSLFIERQLAELRKLCSDIVIVANDRAAFAPWQSRHVKVIPDLQPGSGPLAGLQAAMTSARTESLWVVACDMPFASAAAASAMAELLAEEGMDAVMPMLDGKVQPLHAMYRRRCLAAVDELLRAEQYRVMALLHKLNYTAAEERFFLERGISTQFAVNVNELEHYNKLRQPE